MYFVRLLHLVIDNALKLRLSYVHSFQETTYPHCFMPDMFSSSKRLQFIPQPCNSFIYYWECYESMDAP